MQEKVEDIHMMAEEEAVMVVVQMEDVVLHQMEGHLHVPLMADHQVEDHLLIVLMTDHQVAEAVLQKIEAADHLHLATADQKAHHQKEEVGHQAADVAVKRVVLLTDNFH